MSLPEIPSEFKASYEDYMQYPTGLLCQSSYSFALEAYSRRLSDAAPRLFVSDEEQVVVPFRDMVPASGDSIKAEKKNILSDVKLREWLGDKSGDGNDASTRQVATRPDPKCRFIFILADHSRAPLKITHEMLLRLLSYHQVMPAYLDFLSVFGSQSLPRDIQFSGFREQILLSQSPVRGPAVPGLRRSGRQYQLCYNLRAVASHGDSPGPRKLKQWSIRQAGFHHQFDVVLGTTLWIITRGGTDIKERIQHLTKQSARPEDRAFSTVGESFRSSLSVHILLCHWASDEWRWYLQWLEEVVETETRRAAIEPRDDADRREYTPEDVQSVQTYEDKANEATMVLEANVDVLHALRRFYSEKLTRYPEFRASLRDVQKDAVFEFAAQLDDMIYDAKVQIARARLLVRIIRDRKMLVIQHLQTQATEKMEALTLGMSKVSLSAQREAIIMRIITVGTLIYLPATFVSTFFGTDIVKYQNDPDIAHENGSFSTVAMTRWLAVTVPLTLLTLILAYAAFKIADKHRQRDPSLQVAEGRALQRKQAALLTRTASMLSNMRTLTWRSTGKTAEDEV